MQLYQKCLETCYKKRIKKFVLEVPKRIKRFQQNTFVKLPFSDSDSEQVQ